MVSIANLLILVLATTIALVIQRGWLHRIAVNYIALALGILIAVIPWLNQHVTAFNETVFMGGLVAPLLFFDGKEMRLGVVRQQVKSIVGMTVVMALLALLATGFTLRGLFNFNLPLAFLLAAISIPTDATATGAVAQGVRLPPRAALNLKLESLFNDASGLILMSMALEWYRQGRINYQGTAWSFVYAAIGGVIFGWLVAWGLLVVRHHLYNADTNFTNSLANNGTPAKVLLLLTPFLVYFGAEHFHLSGIIAVVVAGLVGNTEDERSRLVNPALAYDNQRLIASLQELMNGAVFVILGVVLVRTIMNDRITYGSWTWISVGVVLYLVNLVIRLGYAKLGMRQTMNEAWTFAFGGVHGTVTLALVMMTERAQLPTQWFNLLIMAESVLIGLSLIVPTLVFKWLLPPDVSEAEQTQEVNRLRQGMVAHARQRLNEIYVPLAMRHRLEEDLTAQLGATSMKNLAHQWHETSHATELSQPEQIMLGELYYFIFNEELQYLEMIEYQEEKYRQVVKILAQEVMLASVVVSQEN